MNQLYTEYLIDFAIRERHNQAARSEQLRAVKAANPAMPGGIQALFRRFRVNRPQSGGSTLISPVANEPQRAMPC